MLRREFVTGVTAALFASQMSKTTARQPPCVAVSADPHPDVKPTDYPNYTQFLEAKYPLPKLTPLSSFQVTLSLSNSRFLGHWNEEQRARVTRAAALFQAVWSSQEFKDKITSIDSLIWHESTEDEEKYPAHITGAALYPKLVSNLNVAMPIKLIQTPRDQTAASSLTATELEASWANSATVYDLCNTLSHEYTHYGVSGWSWDADHAGPVRRYVSYGVGGLTENLAAGFLRCCDDPTAGPLPGGM